MSFLLKELTLYDMFLVKKNYFHFNCNFMEYFTKLVLKIICFNKTCTKGNNGDHEYIEILSFLLKELTLYDMFLVKKNYFHFNCNSMEYFNKLVMKIRFGEHIKARPTIYISYVISRVHD